MPDPHVHVELHPLTLLALKAGPVGVFLFVDKHWGVDSVRERIQAHNLNKQTNKPALPPADQTLS